jgi:hypothetical protein
MEARAAAVREVMGRVVGRLVMVAAAAASVEGMGKLC